MQKITPFLWFDSQAEEAAKLYTSLFSNSKIGAIVRYDSVSANAANRPKGSVMTVDFTLLGQQFVGLNGGPIFPFTPAVSLFYYTNKEKDLDTVFAKLSKGGKVLMPLQQYPFAKKFAFFQDKYGLSWQLMLADVEPHIAPSLLFVDKKLGKAEAAVKLYTSIFKKAKINTLALYKKGMPGKEGTVEYCSFSLEGQKFVAMDGTGPHAFDFNESVSFAVNCDDQAEIDYFWEKLSKGGSKSVCGWLKDKFGVSWQVVPSQLSTWLRGPHKDKIMAAVMTMTKPDMKLIEDIARGK